MSSDNKKSRLTLCTEVATTCSQRARVKDTTTSGDWSTTHIYVGNYDEFVEPVQQILKLGEE